MKRLLVIALLLSYSVASFGLCINMEYCCGELEGISIEVSHPMSKEGKEQYKDDDCCAQNHIDLPKINDSQIASEQISLKLLPAMPLALLPQIYSYPCAALSKASGSSLAFYKEPPNKLPSARRALYCVFRI